MTITAIETKYAGCHFRSRLEARWAVFFDRLKIKWEYEPEGVKVSWRLSMRPDEFAYLPDFWLPELKMWVEVKGSLTTEKTERLLNAAASLSSNDGAGCHDQGGNDLVVLGPLPSLTEDHSHAVGVRFPWRLHMHKGDLFADYWHPRWSSSGNGCTKGQGHIVATDYGGSFEDITSNSGWPSSLIPMNLIANGYGTAFPPDDEYVSAIRAARSARFEHGESGA